jgi:gliding motility-associated-like protein
VRPTFHLSFLLFLTVSFGYAQNLIPNSGFEKTTKALKSKKNISVEQTASWFSGNSANFDLLKGAENSKEHSFGKLENRFAGIVLFDASNSNFRMYVEVKLKRSLMPDEELCLWISVKASAHSSYFTDELGIALTQDALSSKTQTHIDFIPQLKSQKYQAISDTSLNGKKLEFRYKAKGGEQFITIGNFRNDAHTLLLPSNSLHFPKQAYLYIDDVYLGNCDLSLEEQTPEPVIVNQSNSEVLPQGKMHVPNVLTPNKDGFNDSFFIVGLPRYSKLKIHNKKGKEVYKSENYRNDWDGGDLPQGTYQFELLLPDGNRIDGPLDIVRKRN